MKLPLVVVSTLAFLPALAAPDRFFPSRATARTHVAQAVQSPPQQGAAPTPKAPTGDEGRELNGTYLCEGVRPDGRPYHGTVSIFRHNGAYQLLWSVGSEEQYLGIGIVNGDVLAVSYFGGAPGVVAYRIDRSKDKGARLVGHWTVANADGQVFGETLTWLTPDVVAPPPTPERRPQRLQPSRGIKPA